MSATPYMLPCLCVRSGPVASVLWVHERARRMGVARFLVKALRIRKANQPLPGSVRRGAAAVGVTTAGTSRARTGPTSHAAGRGRTRAECRRRHARRSETKRDDARRRKTTRHATTTRDDARRETTQTHVAPTTGRTTSQRPPIHTALDMPRIPDMSIPEAAHSPREQSDAGQACPHPGSTPACRTFLCSEAVERCCRHVRPVLKGEATDADGACHATSTEIGLDPGGVQGAVAWLRLGNVFARGANAPNARLDKAARRRMHWLAAACRRLAAAAEPKST